MAAAHIWINLPAWLSAHLRAHARAMGISRGSLIKLLIAQRRGSAIMRAEPPVIDAPAVPAGRVRFRVTLSAEDAGWLADVCHRCGDLSPGAVVSMLFVDWRGLNPLGSPASGASCTVTTVPP